VLTKNEVKRNQASFLNFAAGSDKFIVSNELRDRNLNKKTLLISTGKCYFSCWQYQLSVTNLSNS